MIETARQTKGRYPFLPIRDAADYERASAVLGDLFGREDLDDEASGYLDTLIKLVGDYEQREHAVNDDLTPIEMVQHLMDANGLTVGDIGRIIGSQSAASDFLNGKAGLSMQWARRLADYFRLSPDDLLPTDAG